MSSLSEGNSHHRDNPRPIDGSSAGS
jgi:hypothetical protein